MIMIKHKKFGEVERENQFYLVEMKKDATRHIIDESMLLTMLCGCFSAEDLLVKGAATAIGWHKGKDNLIYERHILNKDSGEFWYNVLKVKEKAPNLLLALEEINTDINQDHLLEEKDLIRWCFIKNQIKKITKYEGKEYNISANKKVEQKEENALKNAG